MRGTRSLPAPDESAVLYVSHTGYWGGGGEIVLEQLTAAARAGGYRPYLMCPDGEVVRRAGRQAEAVFPVTFPWLRRTVHPLVWFRLLQDWLSLSLATVAALRTSQAAVIHANSGVAALSVLLPSLVLSRPLIWHQHDIVPDRAVNRLVLGLCGRLCSAVLATSRATALSLRRLGIPEEKIHVLHPRVRSDFMRSAPGRETARDALGIEAGSFVVMVIGRLVPRKAQDVVLRAVGAVLRSGLDAHVLLLGDTPPVPGEDTAHAAYREELHALASSPPLAGRVSFLPFRDDVLTVLAASDVLVMPSYEEPFGIVMLEALAAGVPVIASASAGPLEILQDGVTGMLVPPGDVDALADTIERLGHDGNLRRRLVEGGLAHIQASFDESTLGPALSRLYEGLLLPHAQTTLPARSASERSGQ